MGVQLDRGYAGRYRQGPTERGLARPAATQHHDPQTRHSQSQPDHRRVASLRLRKGLRFVPLRTEPRPRCRISDLRPTNVLTVAAYRTQALRLAGSQSVTGRPGADA